MKDPRLLKYLGWTFLAAPFCNLILSLFFHQSTNPTSSEAVLELFQQIRIEDWAWLFLLFISGILLLIQHKTAWLIAILSLLTVVFLNVNSLLSGQKNFLTAAQEVQVLFSIFASACCLIILFHARYPYIDRRQGWFRATAERFDLKTPVEVELGRWILAESESISSSGCRIRIPEREAFPAGLRFVFLRFPEIQQLQIKAQVVGYENGAIRLKFRDFTGNERQTLTNWIRSKVRVVAV